MLDNVVVKYLAKIENTQKGNDLRMKGKDYLTHLGGIHRQISMKMKKKKIKSIDYWLIWINKKHKKMNIALWLRQSSKSFILVPLKSLHISNIGYKAEGIILVGSY